MQLLFFFILFYFIFSFILILPQLDTREFAEGRVGGDSLAQKYRMKVERASIALGARRMSRNFYHGARASQCDKNSLEEGCAFMLQLEILPGGHCLVTYKYTTSLATRISPRSSSQFNPRANSDRTSFVPCPPPRFTTLGYCGVSLSRGVTVNLSSISI